MGKQKSTKKTQLKPKKVIEEKPAKVIKQRGIGRPPKTKTGSKE